MFRVILGMFTAEKTPISYRKSGKVQGKSGFGVWGCLGRRHFHCKRWPKSSVGFSALPWNGSLSIPLSQIPKSHQVHVFRLGGRVHDSQNQVCLSLEQPNYFRQTQINTDTARTLSFFEISKSRKPSISKISIRREPGILKIRLTSFQKSIIWN